MSDILNNLEAGKQLATFINEQANGTSNVQKLVLVHLQANALPVFVEAALHIARNNKDNVKRNAKLSILRVQLGRACKALERAKLTVKADGETFVVVEVVPKEKAEKPVDLSAALAVVLDAIEGGDKDIASVLRLALTIS